MTPPKPNFSSPKQAQTRLRREWYSYYAGYRSEFVTETLLQLMPTSEKILDPWNGSGTTTTTASLLGRESVGIDLNPALALIAMARQTPAVISKSLGPLSRKLVSGAVRWSEFSSASMRDEDLLLAWFDWRTAAEIRAIQAGIHELLIEPGLPAIEAPGIEELPHLGAFFYCCLFEATRMMLQPFRSSNPTWVKLPSDLSQRLSLTPEEVQLNFLEAVEHLKSRLVISTDAQASSATLLVANAEQTQLDADSFDGCLASPPYCTRIDYVRSSLPELAVMNVSNDLVLSLRKTTTGTPVVRGWEGADASFIGHYASELLQQVGAHTTKGSMRYYEPWMRKYFCSLQASLEETCRVMKANSPIGLVVQNSHYKEIEIDLQRVIQQMMDLLGRSLQHRSDFQVKHLRSAMNPRSRLHAPNKVAHESLLVF